MAQRLVSASLRLPASFSGPGVFKKRTFSSTPCRLSATSMAADGQPAWLQRVLCDPSAAVPPRLYRWTAGDVVGDRDGTTTRAQAAADTNPRRIYILGVGNLGRLFAAALAQLPDRPPITLVVHRPGLLAQWHQQPGVVLHPQSYLGTAGTGEADADADADAGRARYTGFDVEMWSDEPPPPGAGDRDRTSELPFLANLIVATKAQAALDQVDRVRRYLGPASTVAFVQNGMNKLWPPAGPAYNAARYGGGQHQHPRWVACVVTHGVLSLGPFASVLAAPADVKLGVVDGGAGDNNGADAYLVQQLLAAPVLAAQQLPRPALWVTQLEKLAVNAVINPLTALLRCRNGELFGTATATGDDTGPADCLPRIIDQLLREASSVFQGLARHDPSSRRILGLVDDDDNSPASEALLARLSFDALRAMVYRVGALVRDNTSSMLQDVRAGRPTEVREFNGWVVDTAAYLSGLGVAGLDARGHQALVALVEAGEPLTRAQLGAQFR